MSETTYRWANVYVGGLMLHETQKMADFYGDTRIRCDRYRLENGVLIYDPEPTPEPPVDFEAWLVGDEDSPSNRGLCRISETPSKTWKHVTRVRVRDKAADDAMVETMQLRLAGLEEQRQRAIAAESQVATLTRERDEAIKARDDWQMSAEWGWGDVGHGTELLKQAKDRIAELERQLAEKPVHELYTAVGDFLDVVEPGWLMSSMTDKDFSVFQVRAEIDGRRVTCYGRSLPEACRKWLEHHSAALAAKEKTDG